MNTTAKAQLEASLNAAGVKAGTAEAKDAITDLGATAATQGRKIDEALSKSGDGAKEAAQKVDSSTRSMVNSIERATAAAKAGQKGTAGYFEALAQQRGIDPGALRPYIDELRRVEQANTKVDTSFRSVEMSAKQVSAAMRQVPAQFTDIVTSLQAGQSPITVLLQQGGQLRDQFGGIGAAAKALGGFLATLITPLNLAAAAVGVLAFGYIKGSQEAQEFTKALVLSGNAVGLTTSQLIGMSEAIAGLGGATQARASEVLTQIAGAGEVGAQNVERFTRAALELERAGGPAAEKTAEAFAELGRKPLEASEKLNQSMRYLTASTYETIQQLVAQGRETEAARVAQEAYANAIESRTPQLVERLGLVERAWEGIKTATKKAGDAILDIGREGTIGQQIKELEAARARYERLGDPNGGLLGVFGGNKVKEIDQQIAALRESERLASSLALRQAESVRREEAGVAWAKLKNENLDKTEKYANEVLRITNLGVAAGQSEVEIAKHLQALKAKTFTEKAVSRTGKSPEQLEAERQAKLLNELSGLTATYTEDVERLNRMRSQGLITEERYGDLLRQLVANQPFAKKGAAELAKEIERQEKATAEAVKVQAQYVDGLNKANVSGKAALLQLEDELIGLTQGKRVLNERLLLRLEEQAAAVELQAIRAFDRGLDESELEALKDKASLLRKEAELRRDIARATENNEVEAANKRAADKAAEDWQRSFERVEQSLVDSLMRGGKSVGEYLADYFRTLILRPVVQAIVSPITGGITGALGLSSAANAAGPGGASSAMALGSLAGLGQVFRAGAALGSQGFGGLSATLQNAAAYFGQGGYGTALANAGGGITGFAGPAVVGQLVGRQIGGGYSLNGGSGSGTINLGTAIGAFFGGPIGAGIGSAIGGVVNRAFGRKAPETRAQGVVGSFGGSGGFSGQTFQDWFQSGGWFRSDKSGTAYGVVASELETLLDDGAKGILAGAKRYAEVLGIPAAQLSSITTQARISLGDNEQENQAAIAKSLDAYAEALGDSLGQYVGKFQKAGESITDTLQRLTTLSEFAKNMDSLGGVFGEVARKSTDAVEQMIGLAGGLEQFRAKALQFAQDYYNRDEIAGLKAAEVQDELRKLGISQDLTSRDDFRRLVESSAGDPERLNRLLDIAPAFTSVADYLAESGLTLSQAAAAAPDSLLTEGNQIGNAQLDALLQGNGLLGGILDEIRGLRTDVDSSRVFRPVEPESRLAR